MIKAIIVDDEVYWCEFLAKLLKDHCPEIQIASVCNSVTEALRAIQEHKPQLLFLDIEMPEMNGFQLLDKIKPCSFELILMCERDQNAVNAIHYGALDYLLKPVSITDLKKAVEKTAKQLEPEFAHQIAPILLKIHENLNSTQNLALPTIEGLQVIARKSIIYCSSDSNYTNFRLKDNQKLHVCRTLKEVENILGGYPFIRVHHSYIVNLNEVKKYIKGEGGSLVMSDNTNINVSRSHKELLLKKLVPGKN